VCLAPAQGSRSLPQFCAAGVYTNCFSAACNLGTSWNGLNATCYCPVYHATSFLLAGVAADGYSGQSVDGRLTYVQNGP
jgi:hypothetical protein